MKKSTKILATALVGVVGMGTASTLVGCSGKENKDLKDFLRDKGLVDEYGRVMDNE